jgi:hypothetical protein
VTQFMVAMVRDGYEYVGILPVNALDKRCSSCTAAAWLLRMNWSLGRGLLLGRAGERESTVHWMEVQLHPARLPFIDPDVGASPTDRDREALVLLPLMFEPN